MKLIGRAILICGFILVFALAAFPQKRSVPAVRIEGTYDNLRVGPESSDLVGMRVMLIDGGGGIYAIVQEAEGGVELPEPAMAEVTVKGSDISFTIKFPRQDETQTFSGKVSASGLRLRRANSAGSSSGGAPNEPPYILKRRKC